MADYSKLSDAEIDALLAKGKPAKDYSSMSDAELDAHLGAVPAASAQPAVGQLDTASRGAAQGLSMGFADELTGRAGQLAGALGLVPDVGYEYYRDYARKQDKAAEAANPKTYTGAQIAGGVAPAFIPGVNLVGGGLGKAAALGAAQGGATGAGTTENDVTSSAGLWDIGTGMAAGGLGGSAGYGVGKVITGAPSLVGRIRGSAEKLAEKSTGATAAQAEKFADNAGRKLLDEGFVKFGDSPRNIAERAAARQNASGAGIGDALSTLDDAGVAASLDNVMGSLQSTIDELRQVQGNEKIIKKLIKERDSLVRKGLGNGWETPVSSAEQAKRNFANQVNFASKEAKKTANAKIGSAYRSEVERAAIEADPELARQFIADKELFGFLAPIREAAERRATQLNQSPFGGLGDTAAIAATAALGPKAVLAAGARRVFAPRLASSLAVGEDTIANILAKLNNKVGSAAAPIANSSQVIGRAVGSSPWQQMKAGK